LRKSSFQTKISKARFVVSPFTAQQMVELGQVAVDSIKSRLERAENVYDQPAKPLSEGRRGTGYRRYKSGKAPPAIRNWKLTGRTLRGMNVLRANENRAVIGFSDPVAAMRAAINQKRERQFGLSPANWKDIFAAVRRIRFVRVKSKAA
jgi:hypothetical protein